MYPSSVLSFTGTDPEERRLNTSEAKRYLLDTVNLINQAADLLTQIEDTEAGSVTAIHYDAAKVKHITTESQTERNIDYLQRIRAKYKRTDDEVKKRIDMIKRLDKPMYTKVLLLRYTSGRVMPLREIAKNINRSYNRTTKLHSEAIRMFDRKYFG